MKKVIVMLTFLSVLFSATANAADICAEAEKKFKDAVNVYEKEGALAFVEWVLKNDPLEGDKRSLGQFQGLTQIEQYFGSIKSSSVLSKKPLGNKVCYLIGVLEYSDGPAFAAITYYLGEKGVGATSMFFKTEPESVLPKIRLIE